MRLAIIGRPGAGKTTVGEILAPALGVVSISTGQMLREARREGFLSPDAAIEMDAGRLMPEGLVDTMLVARLSKPEYYSGWILDGYPRRHSEAEVLLGLIHPVSAVIYLDLHEKAARARIAGRGECPAHRSVVATEHGRCPNCGGPAAGRDADRPHALDERMATHERHSDGVLGTLGDLVLRVNAMPAPDRVAAAVLELLSHRDDVPRRS
jgi:adenylate kinase